MNTQDPHELWAQCLLAIEQRVRPVSFNTWFKPTQARCLDANQLILAVPTSYFAEFVGSHYLTLIRQVVQEQTAYDPSIQFEVMDEHSTAAVEQPIRDQSRQAEMVQPSLLDWERSPIPDAAPPKSTAKKQHQQRPVARGKPASERKSDQVNEKEKFIADPEGLVSQLNSRYTFEKFVIGEGNRLAHAAAQAVARSPGRTQFNPLVIYGGVGLGKTHLLQAIGHHAKENTPNCNVVFVPSDQFMNSFVEAIRTNTRAEFKKLFRSADILLVDDIQFIIKRGEATQNEFFYTFNALHQAGRQIAVTCDSRPEELEGLEERLISRFQWGLVTNIEPPDLETRIAILHQKAEIHGIQLPNEVAAFLGNHISSNVRELEGALNHLMAYTTVNHEEITVDAARKMVQQRLPKENSQVNIGLIQQKVAEHFSLTQALLIGKTRRQEVAQARQVAMYLAKQLTKNPLTVIGLHFGNRDHSTVIHALKTIEKKRKTDNQLDQLLKDLMNLLKTGSE